MYLQKRDLFSSFFSKGIIKMLLTVRSSFVFFGPFVWRTCALVEYFEFTSTASHVLFVIRLCRAPASTWNIPPPSKVEGTKKNNVPSFTMSCRARLLWYTSNVHAFLFIQNTVFCQVLAIYLLKRIDMLRDELRFPTVVN